MFSDSVVLGSIIPLKENLEFSALALSRTLAATSEPPSLQKTKPSHLKKPVKSVSLTPTQSYVGNIRWVMFCWTHQTKVRVTLSRSQSANNWKDSFMAATGHITQVRHFINAHKVLTPVVVISLMSYYGFYDVLAWVYLALHGTYCLLWMIKEYAFRDRRFEEEIHPLAGFIFVFCGLGVYWIAPYLIISEQLSAPNWLLTLAIFTTMVGVFFHYVSDAHKHAVLSVQKGLITTGLFARTRNPNYFGEMLIYLGFAMLAQHWAPFLALAYWWVFFFRNMMKKDQSMSRHPEFADWRKRTGLVIPKIF